MNKTIFKCKKGHFIIEIINSAQNDIYYSVLDCLFPLHDGFFYLWRSFYLTDHSLSRKDDYFPSCFCTRVGLEKRFDKNSYHIMLSLRVTKSPLNLALPGKIPKNIYRYLHKFCSSLNFSFPVSQFLLAPLMTSYPFKRGVANITNSV